MAATVLWATAINGFPAEAVVLCISPGNHIAIEAPVASDAGRVPLGSPFAGSPSGGFVAEGCGPCWDLLVTGGDPVTPSRTDPTYTPTERVTPVAWMYHTAQPDRHLARPQFDFSSNATPLESPLRTVVLTC